MSIRLNNFITATALTSGDVFYITQGGVEKQVSASAVLTFLTNSIAANGLPVTVATASGDGSTVNFTLPYVPGSVNNVRVILNGLALTPTTDYTNPIGTSTITMTTPPALGDELVFWVGGQSAPGISVDSSMVAYTPTSGGTTNVQSQLRAITAPTGSSLVGFQQSGTGAVARTVQDKARESVSVLDFYANGVSGVAVDPTGVVDSALGIQAAITANPGKRIYAPKGTYKLGQMISLLGWYGEIYGDGMEQTIFQATSAMTSVFNLNESADVVISPVNLKGFTIDGNSLATNGYNQRYRHHTHFTDLVVKNCTNGGQEKDSWINLRENVRYMSNVTDLWLVGSNHNSHWNRCSMIGATTTHLLVQSNGTVADGNSALKFTACDIEYGVGAAIGADITCTDLTFDTCYLGENIGGAIITNRGGVVNVTGGSMFFGYTATAYLTNPQAGKTVFRGSVINGQTYGSTTNLAGPGTGSGKVGFYDTPMAITIGGNQVVPMDFLDYGPQGVVFAPRLGRVYSSAGNNVTVANSSVNNELTATATAAPGPTPLISVYAGTVLPAQWVAGLPIYLTVAYSSTKAANIYLSTGVFGGNSLIGTLPATAGVKTTYFKLDYNLPTTAYAVLEFILQSVVVADYLTIYDVTFSDSRMLNKGAAALGNLYKC